MGMIQFDEYFLQMGWNHQLDRLVVASNNWKACVHVVIPTCGKIF